MKTLSILLILAATNARADYGDMIDHGGPVMQPAKIVLIFWTPPGTKLDPTQKDGIGNYETLIQRFFNDLTGTPYMNIASEYPSDCGKIPINQNCLGPISVIDVITDTTAFPEAGTKAAPILDKDIQAAVSRAITNKNITPGFDTEFFVFLPAGIEECKEDSCTFESSLGDGSPHCAYHRSFTQDGDTTGMHPVIYAVMPQVNSLNHGCDGGVIVSPNGQMAADREIVILSHEFYESVTDPTSQKAWITAPDGKEVGDVCNQEPGPVAIDGSNMTVNGHKYVVQTIWSNDGAGCSLGFSPAVTGPSVEYKITTGGDDLRADSEAKASLDVNAAKTLKTQTQPEWANGSTHVRVYSAGETQSMGATVTLIQHPHGSETEDNWKIDGFDLKLRNANGSFICEQNQTGSPLVILSGSNAGHLFATPSCAPAPPANAQFKTVAITFATGNDNARSDTELIGSFAGQPQFCLKPSNNADPDGICANGGSAQDQNGQQEWKNWTSSTQTFTLAAPVLDQSSFTTFTVQLIEHDSNSETDDNWDIQGLQIVASNPHAPVTILKLGDLSNNGSGNSCYRRVTGSLSSMTFNINSGNPPGSCPQ